MKADCGCEIDWTCNACCGEPACVDPAGHVQWEWSVGTVQACGQVWTWWRWWQELPGEKRTWEGGPFMAARAAWFSAHREKIREATDRWEAEESTRDRLDRIEAQLQVMA